jgi:hypothetical protein
MQSVPQPERHVAADDGLYKLENIMTDATDGGYYAIKGFLYQFDCALIEMLRNPTINVAFENRQDIDYDDYVLQIKHRETQSFISAKVRKAVVQLLSLFAASRSLKLILYCHFRDKCACDWRPTMTELDEILGNHAKQHSDETRRAFLKSFIIRFSDDYETQFRTLLSLIKSDFSIRTEEEAIIYHSFFRAHLLTRSILPKGQRLCSRQELAALRSDSEQVVFYSAYSRYLGDSKYEAMLRKNFFTFTSPNIENFERLFILQAESSVSRETVLECATRLSRKYFRRGKSPQPYVCLRGISPAFINNMKRSLVDQGVTFFDGTHFNGDRFRPEELIIQRVNDPQPLIKFVPESALHDIIALVDFAEVFQIYVHSPLQIQTQRRHVCMSISDLAQAARVIK